MYVSLGTQSGGVYKIKYTTAAISWHVRHARDKRVAPGVLACSGSMIASVNTLDHANTHMLLLSPDESVRQMNIGGGHKLTKYNWFYIGMHCSKRMCSRIS